MGLASFTELKAEILDWLARPDLSAKAATFITLFEASIRPKFVALDDTVSATFNMVAGTATSTLPVGAERLLNLSYTSSAYPKLTQMGAGEAVQSDVSGVPCRYSLEGARTLRWDRVPDGAYEVMAFYKDGFDGLDDSTASNWLLETYPNLYLYGALTHAKSYMGEGDQAEVDRQLSTAMVDFEQEMNRRKLVKAKPSFYRRWL